MRLLVVTQEVDTESKTLGFFHAWVGALAPHYDSIEVICLKEGAHALPEHVHVHSLGKESGAVSSLVYTWRFMRLAWNLRHSYDAVFVHMNQEYILIAGWLWKCMRKPVYLWRNHYAGSIFTDAAVAFCAKVFCTSTHSYTARFKKTVLMPVGVELEAFGAVHNQERPRNTLLFLARVAPSKQLEILIEAIELLTARGVQLTVTIVGDALPEHQSYLRAMHARVHASGLEEVIHFAPGVPHAQTPLYFGIHAICVNCSKSGMFDKTLFEAAAAGCEVLAVSNDFSELTNGLSHFTNAQELARAIERSIAQPEDKRREYLTKLSDIASSQSLATLVSRLVDEVRA